MQSNKNIKKRNSIISKQQHITEELSENGVIQYNCTACRKTFRSRSQKYYHLNCNQLQKFLYQCEHCDKSFVRKSQWKYHNESHLSPINECKRCQKIFSNPLALKKHLSLHKVEPKFCPHCDKSFKKKVSLEQHIAAQHLNQLQYGCAYCNKKYASKSTLQLHLQSHERKRFECTLCEKQFQRNSILKLHLKRHNNSNVICNICKKVFSESGALARHSKIHEENVVQYHCKLCDKNILRKDNMTRHLNTIHPDEKFDNIVEIIRPMMSDTNLNPKHTIAESESIDIDTFKGKNKNIPGKNFVIIENKLLQKPYEHKDSIIELSKNITNEISTYDRTKYPLINQIKVITAIHTYEKEIFNESNENKTINHQQQVDSKIFEPAASPDETNCDLKAIPSKFVEQNENNIADNSLGKQKSQNQTENETKMQDTFFDKDFFQHRKQEKEQPLQIYEPPKTQTISSVIRSVGNAKNLTYYLEAPVTPIKQTCLEYKHKKYCRNNYNIDLYRKILGCDEDDDEKEQPNCIFTPQTSSTAAAVHWRKSFKNNYETWSS
ncbi:PR domain zinc finger protein 15 [Lucilia sericata]|uniref:PR domain zinc finger protein 15 n=1 Tax=Lucilia sericata TaxID=13632 RepID=UPI0018A8761A|nr:PR domain zinc finger protein 15 [Lucilia sericata]